MSRTPIRRPQGPLFQSRAVELPGPFTARMALDSGLTEHGLRSLVGSGRVLRLLTNVYVDASVPIDLDMRVDALALVAPPEAVIVDRTAAWLHGLDLQRRSALHDVPPIDMYLPKDSRLRRDGVDSGRRLLRPRDVMELRGVRLTTPLRTALDLARGMWRFDALGALDQYLARGLQREELVLEFERFRGYRGVRQARMLLPIADAASESMPESALRLHWHDAMLPWPHAQHWVLVDGEPRYRLDLADAARRYGAEYDGAEFHSLPEDRAHDATRRSVLHAEGWDLDVFTRRSVYGLSPHPVDVLNAGWSRADARRPRPRHR